MRASLHVSAYCRCVSFSGSEKRVRDGHQPIGRRVMCLHGCLEQFNLFGFTATRARLRAMVEASGDDWTEDQLLSAMDALADARRSWVTHLKLAEEHRRAEKPAVASPHRPIHWSWRNEWLEDYLTSDMAVRWMVTGLGECSECDHLLIHHGTWACRICSASDEISLDSRCWEELPAAGVVEATLIPRLVRRLLGRDRAPKEREGPKGLARSGDAVDGDVDRV